MRDKILYIVLFVWFFFALTAGAKGKAFEMLDSEARAVIDEYVPKLKPLDVEARRQWYIYSTTGDKKASKLEEDLTLEIRKLNSNRERFAKIKDLYKQRKKISDELIRRQVEVLYQTFLPDQIDEGKLARLTKLEKRMDEGFNDYQAEVDGKKLNAVEVSHILSDSTDSVKLEKVWKAEHKVGSILEKDYRELVNLRNEIARDLGCKGALELEAEISELPLDVIDKFYKEVVGITDKPFKKLKEGYIDPKLAARYGVEVGDMGPWHYQNAFFQDAPNAIFGKVDLDALYKKTNSNKIIDLAVKFYGSMGVDIRPIIKNSSLFPKPGKNPHAVASYLDPDKPDSSLVIMNLPEPPKPPKANEASTLIHELAHDINYEAILRNKEIPYLLRDPTMLTEAVAMLFEKQTATAEWFKKIGVDEKLATETAGEMEKFDYVDQLIFMRWAAAIHCFERKFYNDPSLDIGDTWWECREKLQLLKRPPDWKNPDALAKYHIVNTSPLYYANYSMGLVANVQFAELLAKKIGEDTKDVSYFGKKALGAWLMNDFLAQGQRYRWDEFLKMSTGKSLSVETWKKYYIDSGIGDRL